MILILYLPGIEYPAITFSSARVWNIFRLLLLWQMDRLRLAEGRRISFSPGAAVPHPLSPECVFLPGHLICLVISPCFLLFFLGINKMMLSQEKKQKRSTAREGGTGGGFGSAWLPPQAHPPLSRPGLQRRGSPALVPVCLMGGRTEGLWGFCPAWRPIGIAVCPRAPWSALLFKPYRGCKLENV